MRGEREVVCIWKGWSVRAWGEGGCVHMEEVECACMGRGCAYGRGGVCMHGERVCIRKWSSVHACMRRGRVCIWKGGVCVHERECVYMEGVECVCIWKGWSVRA